MKCIGPNITKSIGRVITDKNTGKCKINIYTIFSSIKYIVHVFLSKSIVSKH